MKTAEKLFSFRYIILCNLKLLSLFWLIWYIKQEINDNISLQHRRIVIFKSESLPFWKVPILYRDKTGLPIDFVCNMWKESWSNGKRGLTRVNRGLVTGISRFLQPAQILLRLALSVTHSVIGALYCKRLQTVRLSHCTVGKCFRWTSP